jgi:hypothetical protein
MSDDDEFKGGRQTLVQSSKSLQKGELVSIQVKEEKVHQLAKTHKVELVLISFRDNLHSEIPARVTAGIDRVVQIASVVVRIVTLQFLRLVPD